MEQGVYTGRRVDYGRYAAAVFTPYFFSSNIRALMGCGASALALLTGILPEVIARQNQNRAHYADAFMVRFLCRRGFTVLPLTQCSVSASDSTLGQSHVVLLSQLFRKNEATWGVVFGGVYYHNFDINYLDAFSFLNKPILSAYLLSHPNWRLGQWPKVGPARRIRPKDPQFTMHNLYRLGSSRRTTPKAQ